MGCQHEKKTPKNSLFDKNGIIYQQEVLWRMYGPIFHNRIKGVMCK
jgi:hypothetical protein